MSALSDRLRPTFDALDDRIRRLGWSAWVRVQRVAHRRGYVPGLLSIVVPVYNVEEYLDECLVSLRFQHYRHAEIIVVDDGSPDGSYDIARRHARRDPRVIVVRRPNGGLSAARNTGVEHARGEFLTFVDSDDVVAPAAYTSAIAALRESGSDFAVNLYDRIQANKRLPAGRWIREAHVDRRLGETLETFPDAMVNAVAWGKTYRREFWDSAGLRFPEGRLYEDQPVSMAAFAKARGFDVVPEIGVSWRIRTDRSSISQQGWSVENLRAHNLAVRDSLAAIRAEGLEGAAETRALQLLANNMSFFTRHLVTADEEYWELLRTAIGDLVHTLPRERYIREVPAQDKVLYELIMAGRRDDASAFLEDFGHEMRRFRTWLSPEGMRAQLPLTDGLDEDVNLLSDNQLLVAARMMRMSWTDSGDLQLTGWAAILFVDLADHPPQLRIELVSSDGSRVPLDVEPCPDPRIPLLLPHWFCDYRPGGFRALLPRDRMPDVPGEWWVEVTVAAAGLTRRAPVQEVSFGGSAGVAHCRVLRPGLVARLETTHRVRMVVEEARVYATSAVVTPQGELDVALVCTDRVRSVAIGSDERRPAVSVTPLATGDATWRATLPLSGLPGMPTLPLRGARKAVARPLRVLVQVGNEMVPVLAPPTVPAGPGLPSSTGRQVTRSTTGALEILDWLPVAVHLELEDDRLAVRLRLPAVAAGWTPVLRTPDVEVEGTLTPLQEAEAVAEFSLSLDRWGREGLALRPGKYAVSMRTAAGALLPIVPSPEMLPGLSYEVRLPRYRSAVEIFVGNPPGLALNLAPPLADDELGQRNQNRLRRECAVGQADLDGVFFRTLYGEATNDNGLGVHRELRRRGTDLTLYWSVADHSVPLPEGCVALIEETREWHEVVARARYHMVNVHQLAWFEKPRGQVMIQTMHGYPYKVMGHAWWRKGAFSGSQIRSYDRRARDWDYFVSPATYATPLLKAAFLDPAGAAPEVLEIGYPRNDVLLSPDAGRIREETRRLLGIRPEQTAVMYAPTFRDYLSADDMAAERVDFFDADQARGMLGDDVVLLIRGHAFNARSEGRLASDERVIDVTDHPDVNELILASDVAVLDYSSIRFDYALTDKPMIFLVPDLERYDAARGGVIDYAPTAPGPHVKTTREVVRLIERLDEVDKEYAEARARFRAEYTDLDDGHASARLVDAVFVPRGDAPPTSPGAKT